MKIIKLCFSFIVMGSLFQTVGIFSSSLRSYQTGTRQLQRQLPKLLPPKSSSRLSFNPGFVKPQSTLFGPRFRKGSNIKARRWAGVGAYSLAVGGAGLGTGIDLKKELEKKGQAARALQREKRSEEILAGDFILSEDRALFTENEWNDLINNLENKEMIRNEVIEGNRQKRKAAEERERFEVEDNASWWPSQRKLQNKWTGFKNYWYPTRNSTK